MTNSDYLILLEIETLALRAASHAADAAYGVASMTPRYLCEERLRDLTNLLGFGKAVVPYALRDQA